MKKSESFKNLAKALAKFQANVPVIGKDAKNPFFKSKYATLSKIQQAIQPALTDSGLVVTCVPDGENQLSVMVIHSESGEYICGTFQMKPVKEDPQAQGSAITYLRRYSIAAILNLNVDDDDDANAASGRYQQSQQSAETKASYLWRIDDLLRNANISAEKADWVENVKHELTDEKAVKLIAWLEENQLEESPQNGNATSKKSAGKAVADKVADPKA